MDLTAALNILTDALARCRKEDMRTVEVFAALDALAINATAQWPFEQFRKALDSDNRRRPVAEPQRFPKRRQVGRRATQLSCSYPCWNR